MMLSISFFTRLKNASTAETIKQLEIHGNSFKYIKNLPPRVKKKIFCHVERKLRKELDKIAGI